MATPATFDLANLLCQDTVTSSKGAKQIHVTHLDGTPVLWQPVQPMSPLWEPSAFNDPAATRLNVSFAASHEVSEQLKLLDEWSLITLASESARLLGSPLDMDEVKRRYQPALRVYGKTGSVSMRCKMNVSGRNQVKCWDHFRQMRSLPESWTACTVVPRVRLAGLWVMGKEVGWTFTLEQALIDEASQECPF